MKTKTIFAAALLVAALPLSGCGAGLYEAKSWTSPDGDAVTADWDVASAKCEAEALEEEADEEEKESVQGALESAAEVKSTLDTIGSLTGVPTNPADALGGDLLLGGLIGAAPHVMDEGAKNERFTECMQGLGWKQAEE